MLAGFHIMCFEVIKTILEESCKQLQLKTHNIAQYTCVCFQLIIIISKCLIIGFCVLGSRNYTLSDEVAFWTSGVDVFTPRDFYWDSTGLTLNGTYSNWSAGEPNNLNGIEQCVDLFSKKNYLWNDNNCKNEQFFICEWHSSCNDADFQFLHALFFLIKSTTLDNMKYIMNFIFQNLPESYYYIQVV